MLLTKEKSICDPHQAIVVSKDVRQSREHRAVNPERKFSLRHYKLDGDIVQNEKCCDFLLINDDSKKAYFIELKGVNVDEAVDQLQASATRFSSELDGYAFLYRIVCSRVRTHNVQKTKYRKFQEKCGAKLQTKVGKLEERLD